MNYSTLKPLVGSLSVALVATVAATSTNTALAQRGHGGSMSHAMDCETWLDGRAEQHVPPRCRELAGQLNQLRRATSAFYSADVARAAGWNRAISPCVESPMGGMGYHVANLDELINPGLSLLRPEALLYAPTEDGSMEFLGVEYIVAIEDLDYAGPAPELLGQAFHLNPVQSIWALHVWTAKPNPEGIFAAWNPDVSCEFGDEFPFPEPPASPAPPEE